MAESRGETVEGQGSSQGGNNNNHQMESTLARMADFLERQENRRNESDHTSSEVPNDVALERFQKFRPPKFNGEMGEEMAEKWIEAIEDIFEALNYSDMRKVAFGKFQLEGPAKAWWRFVEQKWEIEGRPRTWRAFLEEFRKKYVPVVVQEKREEEFIGLRQRTLTVAQYEVQFTRLSKYAPDMVNTEAKRRRRFLQGLNIGIQTALAAVKVDTYAEVVESAQRIESCQGKLREFQAAKRSGSRNWGGNREGPSQGQAKPGQRGGGGGFPQKRQGEPSGAGPAKRGT